MNIIIALLFAGSANGMDIIPKGGGSGGSGTVTAVTASSPLSSTGGTAPNISFIPTIVTTTTFNNLVQISTSASSTMPAFLTSADNTIRFNVGGSTTARHSLVLYQTAANAASAANTNRQTLNSFAVPASVLKNAWDSLFVECISSMTSGATNKQLGITFGGNEFQPNSGNGNGSAMGWCWARIQKTSTGAQYYTYYETQGNASFTSTNQAALAVDETQPITIGCTEKNGTGAAGNITNVFMIIRYDPVSP